MALDRSALDNNIVENILQSTKNNCRELCEIIDRLGLDAETIQKWWQTCHTGLNEVFKDMRSHALGVQDQLVQSIEQLLEKAEHQCRMLGIKIPAYGSEELKLCEEKERLQRKIAEYEIKINEKRKEVATVEKRMNEVCRSLDIKPQAISTNVLPTQEEISALWRKIESLEEEKFKREEKYLEIREKILTITKELGLEASLDMEKIVLSDDVSLFILSDSNMKWVEEHYNSLLKHRDEIKEEISDLREQLRTLWNLLEEDIQHRSQFENRNTNKPLQEIVEALKQEVHRCKDLKAANIQVFVMTYRSQMKDLWEKCHYSVEQQETFRYFQDSCYTEDLLTLHEMEVRRLERYYNSNKEILSLLDKREKLWKQMVELETASLAAERFKNRGGQLLKEEKERNRLRKLLPQMETRLMQLAEEYQECHGNKFTSRGLTVEEIISTSHETLNEERKIKLSARKQQRELQLTPGKSLNPVPCSSQTFANTPTSNTKRKLMVPFFSNSKRIKEQSSAGLKSSATKVQSKQKTSMKRSSRISFERKKRIDKLRRISNNGLNNKSFFNETRDTSYNEFENEMSAKKACRSTVYQEPLSAEVLAIPLPKTPVITVTSPKTPKSVKSRKLNNNKATPNKGLKLKPGHLKLEF